MSATFNTFKHIISNPFKFRFFLFTKLPAAFFVGLRLKEMESNQCVIGVRHSWFSKNPFKSVYFAAEAMAAEMSIGLLAFGYIYKQPAKISMLVIKMEAEYSKKGTGKLKFTCNDGHAIENAIATTLRTGEGVTVLCESIGKNEADQIVATFKFTWSFKAKL
jgi:hypothetical protein